MNLINVKFTLNGEEVEFLVSPSEMLVDVLRQQFQLTGTKVGCRQGDCGACTVIMDGLAVNSCMIPVAKASGRIIETVEGVEGAEGLHPIQEAFIDGGAVQCGFCTPGMIMSGKALLDKTASPSDEEITEAISGNICRCTGYLMISQALKKAAHALSARAGKDE